MGNAVIGGFCTSAWQRDAEWRVEVLDGSRLVRMVSSQETRVMRGQPNYRQLPRTVFLHYAEWGIGDNG